MVAASKMRKAQERMRAARPYSEKVRRWRPTCRPPTPSTSTRSWSSTTTPKLAGFIVVTTDKGLCGGLNTNVLRAVTAKLKELEAQGVRGRGRGHRQQGLGLPEPHRRQGGLARRAAGRHAAPGQADRAGQGAARRLCGRTPQRGVPVLHALHQHDEAGAGGRAVAALSPESLGAGAAPGAAGTTSTSPMRRPSSTSCCCATSRPWSTRRWPKTWRRSSRRAWWR
jgi:hypothetical protein